MQNLKIQNSRETKHIIEKLETQYGIDRQSLHYIFMMNKDNRIYVISKDLAKIDPSLLKIDVIGIYFGELYKESIRLSIEGSQILAPTATKNIIDIEHDEMIEWVKGCDLQKEIKEKDFVIVRYNNPKTGRFDILGCGKCKDGKLVNYVSKSRRLIVVNN